MIRYVDKGTARQHLTDRLMESALNNVGIKADADGLFRDIAENRLPVWIDELPTYDVAEVRHGRWKETTTLDLWECSVCGHMIYSETVLDRKTFHKWCGKCGAKMDEVTER